MAAGPNSFTALIIPMSSSSAPGKPQPPGGSQPGAPDQTLPGNLPKPEHPIYFPLPPGAPYPDQGLPGSQPGIDNTLPPSPGSGWLPVYIHGPSDPRPGTGLPGQQPKPDQGLPPIEEPDIDLPGDAEWLVGWTPQTGWVSVAIVVPDKPVPTPSKRK